MTVKYISSFSVGILHAMVNKAFLEMLCRIYNSEIKCYVTRSSSEMLQECVAARIDVRWTKLPLITNSAHWALLIRYIVSAVYNIFILLFSRRNDVLFYNFNNVFSLRLIDFINRLKKRKVIICCHGEMEYLTNASKHSRGYKKLMTWLVTSYFNKRRRNVAPGLHFLVLGDVIIRNLKPLLSPVLMERFHSIDHPVIDDIAPVSKKHEPTTINVGTVGIMNYYKGSDDYVDVVKHVTDKRIKFSVVGHVQCDPQPLKDAGIDIPDNAVGPLPDDEFNARVQELDYLLYLYPHDNYRLIASGAVLDTIRFRTPGVGIRTDYFDYISEKYGRVGVFADDKQGLIELLNNLPNQKYDFKSIACAMSVESQTPALHAIMENILATHD